MSPLCLGTMMFGAWGNTDHDDSTRIIHRALDAGINFIDTADVYSRGESEEIVGKALENGRRDQVVLATKVHGSMGDDPNERGNSRRWIVREVEKALAFVIRHHAVTAAIVGPRTKDHLESQLGAADVQLSDDVLDRIDEIVEPGVTISSADAGYQNPALRPAARRR